MKTDLKNPFLIIEGINHKLQNESFDFTTKRRTPYQSQTIVQLVDSIIHWDFDITLQTFILSYKIFYTYDVNSNITIYVFKKWNNGALDRYEQYLQTYDVNNNLTSGLNQTWNGNSWVNLSQTFMTYDVNNNQTSKIYQTWNGGAWVNAYQQLSTYDVNNNNTSLLNQNWSGGAWVNSSQWLYTYDVNNNQTSALFQNWGSGAWKNFQQIFYTYHINNNITTYLQKNWNGGGICSNSFLYSYTYDANKNQIGSFNQNWNGSSWVYQNQQFMTYDTNNNLTSKIYQSSNVSDNFSCFYSNTYDAYNYLLTKSSTIFNGSGTTITSRDSTQYFYHVAVTGVNELQSNMNAISVYPNPNKGKFTLKHDCNIYSIEIYNLLAEIVYSKNIMEFQKSIEIDLSTYRKGIYIMKVFNNSSTYYSKIAVE